MSTEERIKDLMASNLQWSGSWSDVDEDYPLLEKQVVDSLGMITLISLLEDEFDVEIDDGDVVPATSGRSVRSPRSSSRSRPDAPARGPAATRTAARVKRSGELPRSSR